MSQTITITIAAPVVSQVPRVREVLRAPDPGHRLAVVEHVSRPAGQVQEAITGRRIERLVGVGQELRIAQLMGELQASGLPTEEWIARFVQIAPAAYESQALSIGQLVVSQIEPHLLSSADQVWSRIDTLCREILQSLLQPGEDIDNFLGLCAVADQEEQLLREQCRRVDRVVSVHRELLEEGVQREEQHMAAARERIQTRLRTLQSERMDHAIEIQSQVDGLRKDLEDAKTDLGSLLKEIK